MRARSWLILGATAMVLSACGGSAGSLGGSAGSGGSFNPFNWFRSGSDEETVEDVRFQIPVDQRPLVANVTALVIEQAPGGAIIRATGLPPEQGWHTAELVNETGSAPVDGVLTFAFRAVPPESPTRVSTQQSRELIVALKLSVFELAGVREIRVVGARNSRVARR